jgi:very-long-chain enoyl-CoA reductase
MLFPVWTPLNLVLYPLFAGLALGMGLSERFGLMTMRYSKFRAEKGIDSRTGMFFLYFIPLLAALGFSSPYLAHPSLVQILALAALCGHYLKRCLEVWFVHQYSGPMDLFSTVSIGAYYTLVAIGISFLNNWALPQADGFFWIGVLLFLVGAAGNFYHHRLLSALRVKTREYVLPRGGWFEYVACPHYLFEILAWLGIALMSRQLFAGLAWLGMAGYLAARSRNTLAWYRQKFPDFPKDRKALIPFLF